MNQRVDFTRVQNVVINGEKDRNSNFKKPSPSSL